MKKLVAEAVGTATLVLFGCGAAVLLPAVATAPGVAAEAVVLSASINQLAISFAFGLAIVAMAYGIGPISGCHINPAVSLGAFIAGRMSAAEMVQYWVAQLVGAAIGAGILFMIASGKPGYDIAVNGLGANGFGEGYLGGYTMTAALIFEIVATFLFVVVILGVTQQKGNPAFAGLAIGLTLVVIHIVGIQVTGVSVNPARSFGPAVFVQGDALNNLWLFIVAPLAGAALAGLAFRGKLLSAD